MSFLPAARFQNALGRFPAPTYRRDRDYLVTGFYTFVRDGAPTGAGLRGSRSAELIEGIGAANQLAADITGRFSPLHVRTA